ncbi:MAG TPA: LptF/LptG family permease [Fimbriimonadaceae bacterium]|nr:LptF/LptG family permease [Fimbriimonadaceae bacterium]
MKRLDALVLKELIGPWIFGVSMFTMLLIAATYLGRIARFVVEGVSPSIILKVTILLLPAILVKTFAMALLLGALLAFGRLSGDSEITAIRAAGVSLYRIVAPVSIFSLLVAMLAFYMNEQVVPAAARESGAIMTQIAKNGQQQGSQPIKHIEVQNGHVVAMFGARNFNLITHTLDGVHVVAYDRDGRETWIMLVKQMQFDYGDLRHWRIIGGGDLLSLPDGRVHLKLEGDAWPEQIPTIASTPDELFADQNLDMDVFSMEEIQERIRKGKETGNLTPDQIRNYEFGYWNKIALPLAAFIFGTLGAALGIRNHRTGAATGFAVAVIIIFTYFTVANFMSVYSAGGLIPPYVASFTPIAIGLIASGVIIWRRNR